MYWKMPMSREIKKLESAIFKLKQKVWKLKGQECTKKAKNLVGKFFKTDHYITEVYFYITGIDKNNNITGWEFSIDDDYVQVFSCLSQLTLQAIDKNVYAKISRKLFNQKYAELQQFIVKKVNMCI